MLKRKKKSWEPFRSCLLKSTANPAHLPQNRPNFEAKLARSAVFSIAMGADYTFYVKNIETHAHAFLPLNISAVGTVVGDIF